MGDDDWGFLLDENIERAVETCLRDHGYRVDHVVSVLEPGVDDLTAVLPYARAEDLILVTKDVSDFRVHPHGHTRSVERTLGSAFDSSEPPT